VQSLCAGKKLLQSKRHKLLPKSQIAPSARGCYAYWHPPASERLQASDVVLDSDSGLGLCFRTESWTFV